MRIVAALSEIVSRVQIQNTAASKVFTYIGDPYVSTSLAETVLKSFYAVRDSPMSGIDSIRRTGQVISGVSGLNNCNL